MKTKKLFIRFIIIFVVFVLFGIIKQNKSLAADTNYFNKDSLIKIQIDGTDEHYLSNSLTANNITIKVGGEIVTPTTKILSTPTSITKGIRYILTLQGVTGAGKLEIIIAEKTLKDSYNNENDTTTITTGIIIDNAQPYEFVPSLRVAAKNGFYIDAKTTDVETGVKKYKLYIDNNYTSEETTAGFSTYYTVNLESKSPYIPDGFIHTEGEEENGYVIQDTSNENEFVWIPVKSKTISVYVIAIDQAGNERKSETVTISLSEIYNEGWPSREEEGTISNNKSIAYFKNSVFSYKGFYVARYEAGIPESLTTAISTASVATRDVSGVPVSKKNQIPWNYISYNNAKANVESMYNTETAKSALSSTYSWDLTNYWLLNSEAKTYYQIHYDSSSWGNYSTSPVSNITQYSTDGGKTWINCESTIKPTNNKWLLKTGNTNYTKLNNIFDLAGNLAEYSTLDGYGFLVGGSYYKGGNVNR